MVMFLTIIINSYDKSFIVMLVCLWHSFIKVGNTNIIHGTILLVKPDTRIGITQELAYRLDFARLD